MEALKRAVHFADDAEAAAIMAAGAAPALIAIIKGKYGATLSSQQAAASAIKNLD